MVMETASNNTINTNDTTNTTNTTSNVAQLSPYNVGREFVRQYYTMLNQGPQHLHRFYNNDSSFVHGGVDKPGEVSKPVFGRDAISKKIDSLNFCDCHAKILQVDCMETIANGIVIQITGELSNNGEQMRRFLQTFVLAPLGHNKFYVRNDIFRYQDEIFPDEDEYSEPGKVDDNVSVDLTHPIQQQQKQPALTQEPEHLEYDKVQSANNTPNKELYENVNGNGNVHDGNVSGEKIEIRSEVIESKTIINDMAYENEEFNKNDLFISRSSPTQQQNQNEQKTYANMVSKNANGPFGPAFSNITMNSFASKTNNESNSPILTSFPPIESTLNAVQPTTGGPLQQQVSPGSTNVSGKPPSSVASSQPREQPREFQSSRDAQQPRDQRNRQRHFNNNPKRSDTREATPGRGSNDMEFGDMDYVKKQYPDEQQVFVGNLPQDIVEDDLRTLFSTYGKILDVRINRQNQKMAQNNKAATPNYGFVTFEQAEIVQQILKQKPIYFNNHRFNVEEKRSQQGKNIQGGYTGESGNRGGSYSRQGGGGQRPANYGNSGGIRSQNQGGNQGNRNRNNQQQQNVPNTGNQRPSGGVNNAGFNGPRNKQTRQ